MNRVLRAALTCVALAALGTGGGTAGANPAAALPAADSPASPTGADASGETAAFAESDAPYDGVWLPFEDGFRLYLPRAWASAEVTGAQAAAGLFYRADNGAAGADAMGVAVGYMAAGGLKTLAELARDFERAGFSEVAQRRLNGMDAIGFERPEDGYRGVAFYHPVYPEYALFVYVLPVGRPGEAVRAVGDAILASITPFQM